MKTLANCTPREFLTQTNKIRKSVANWLELTQIMQIRQTKPEVDESASEEERKAALAKQVRLNLSAILDAILDEHPDETAELLGLICFIEPEDLDKHSMAELLANVADVLNSEEVMSFFISLARLGNKGILTTV